MTQVSMALPEVLVLIQRLQFKGYHVLSFGRDGFACEENGTQIFRATAQGNERFLIKYNPELLGERHAKT